LLSFLVRQTVFVLLTIVVTSTDARAQLPLEVIQTFAGNTGSSRPKGALVDGGDGHSYGTTERGDTFGQGTVFRITPGADSVTVLYSFEGGAGGSQPSSGVIRTTDGNFYGTTPQGGGSAKCPAPSGCGTVFRMTPDGRVTVLHVFDPATGGGVPNGGCA